MLCVRCCVCDVVCLCCCLYWCCLCCIVVPCLIVFGLDWFSVSLCVVVCGVSVFVVFVLAWCGCGFVCLVGYALFCFVVCWCLCVVLLIL